MGGCNIIPPLADDAVEAIAEAIGYRDPAFFSLEFSASDGLIPLR